MSGDDQSSPKRKRRTKEEMEQARQANEPSGIKREYRSSSSFDHDLFKLESAEFQKNLAVDGDEPLWERVAHCHFFHTKDSNGKDQTYSSAIGGHFHEMKVLRNAAGEITGAECVSGPLRHARKKVRGKWKKVVVPSNQNVDHHKHEVVYKASDRLQTRKINVEAVKHMGKVESHVNEVTKPIPGITG